MTREQAVQVVTRDQMMYPTQGGSYTIRRTDDENYEALWRDPRGTVWRLSLDATRYEWGLPSLGR
mgnify:CR=1 FL=1